MGNLNSLEFSILKSWFLDLNDFVDVSRYFVLIEDMNTDAGLLGFVLVSFLPFGAFLLISEKQRWKHQ